jgi:hypothetical protein
VPDECPCHLTFWGSYETSQPRPVTPLSALRGDAQLPPAHIGHGYVTENLMIQVGLTAVVDSQGGLPVFSQCLDGQRNGRRAIAEQFQLLQQHLPLPTGLLMISDRGTYSADHVSRLYRHGYFALCSMRWNDYISWQHAVFLRFSRIDSQVEQSKGIYVRHQSAGTKGPGISRYNVPDGLTIEDGKTTDYVIELGKGFKP